LKITSENGVAVATVNDYQGYSINVYNQSSQNLTVMLLDKLSTGNIQNISPIKTLLGTIVRYYSVGLHVCDGMLFIISAVNSLTLRLDVTDAIGG
jgi:6-phosphogluconate dehydrogenase